VHQKKGEEGFGASDAHHTEWMKFTSQQDIGKLFNLKILSIAQNEHQSDPCSSLRKWTKDGGIVCNSSLG